jgi:hypothetical protein
MDQAISVLAQPGVAMKVDFNPVRGPGTSRGPVQLQLLSDYATIHSPSRVQPTGQCCMSVHSVAILCCCRLVLAEHVLNTSHWYRSQPLGTHDAAPCTIFAFDKPWLRRLALLLLFRRCGLCRWSCRQVLPLWWAIAWRAASKLTQQPAGGWLAWLQLL